MRTTKLRKLIIAMCLTSILSTALAEEPHHIATPADVNQIKQILRQSELDKFFVIIFHQMFSEGNATHREEKYDVDVFLSFVTADTIDEHFVPIYANYLSHDDAEKIIAALQTPGAKLSIQLDRIAAESGDAASKKASTKLTLGEQAALKEFRTSDAFSIFATAQTNASAELMATFESWMQKVVLDRTAIAQKQIRDISNQELKREYSDLDNDIVPPMNKRIAATGFNQIDQVLLLQGEMAYKNARLLRRIAHEARKIDVNSILNPENLVTSEGIESASLKILTGENLFDDFIKTSEAIGADYERSINNIAMSPENRKELLSTRSTQVARELDLELRVSEHVRNSLELQKQIVALCETQLGKTEIKNGKLIFPRDGSAQTYNTLLAKVRGETDEVVKIGREEAERKAKDAQNELTQ